MSGELTNLVVSVTDPENIQASVDCSASTGKIYIVISRSNEPDLTAEQIKYAAITVIP